MYHILIIRDRFEMPQVDRIPGTCPPAITRQRRAHGLSEMPRQPEQLWLKPDHDEV